MSGVRHMRRERQEGEGIDRSTATRGNGICGMLWVDVTDDPGLVRCKLCRKRMGGAKAVAVVAPVAVDPDAPFVPGPPIPLRELGGALAIAPHQARIIERSHAGDDETDRPRWRSLEAAIAKTTAIKHGRAPIRSAWKVEQESRSEGAVRTEHGRDDVIEIDQAFARSFTADVEITRGTHTLALSAAEARHILEDVTRDYASATDWAERLTAAGRATNAALIGRLIHIGKDEMRAELEGKGLVERRREREHQEGKAMAAPAGFDLDGWKEILPLIGMTEATARERMVREDDPLPITPWSGRVIGVRAELEGWVRREAEREREARRKSA